MMSAPAASSPRTHTRSAALRPGSPTPSLAAVPPAWLRVLVCLTGTARAPTDTDLPSPNRQGDPDPDPDPTLRADQQKAGNQCAGKEKEVDKLQSLPQLEPLSLILASRAADTVGRLVDPNATEEDGRPNHPNQQNAMAERERATEAAQRVSTSVQTHSPPTSVEHTPTTAERDPNIALSRPPEEPPRGATDFRLGRESPRASGRASRDAYKSLPSNAHGDPRRLWLDPRPLSGHWLRIRGDVPHRSVFGGKGGEGGEDDEECRKVREAREGEEGEEGEDEPSARRQVMSTSMSVFVSFVGVFGRSNVCGYENFVSLVL
jgi:hypothetical protein